MSDNSSLSNDQFLAAFLDCSLPPAAFDHRGHVRVAWLILRQHPLDEAIEYVCAGIARYANHLGASQKFHRTMSEAFVRLIARSATRFDSWEAFVVGNPELMSNVRGVIARHYSPELIATARAREHFVSPDRSPLPQ